MPELSIDWTVEKIQIELMKAYFEHQPYRLSLNANGKAWDKVIDDFFIYYGNIKNFQ